MTTQGNKFPHITPQIAIALYYGWCVPFFACNQDYYARHSENISSHRYHSDTIFEYLFDYEEPVPFIIITVQQLTDFLSVFVIYRVADFNILTYYTLIAQYI